MTTSIMVEKIRDTMDTSKDGKNSREEVMETRRGRERAELKYPRQLFRPASC
jgi:CRISPR/Cas system Type II protein with McrA/HNH and RuvC-like nuclease domain